MKDIIESFGVPHTEVGCISRFSQPVGFDYFPQNGDIFIINEVIPPFDVTAPSLLRPHALSEVCFIADANVGKLARYLRLIGFDTTYLPELSDKEIARISNHEQRILLTKDRGLLRRKHVIFGRYVRSVFPKDQLTEVVRFFDLKGPFDYFSRCLVCNRVTVEIEKEKILHRLEPKTKKYYDYFKICERCDQIYWKGSHYEHQIDMLKGLSPDIFGF